MKILGILVTLEYASPLTLILRSADAQIPFLFLQCSLLLPSFYCCLVESFSLDLLKMMPMAVEGEQRFTRYVFLY